MIFITYSESHSSDSYRMLKIKGRGLCITRDVTWINKNYIEWSNDKKLENKQELPVSIFQLKSLNIEEEEEDINQNSPSLKDSSNNINNYQNAEINTGNIIQPRLRSDKMKTRIQSNVNYTLVSHTDTKRKTYEEPNNFTSAWDHPNSTERVNWRLAIEDEIKTMVEKNVFELVDREKIPSNQKPILTKWVFKRKMISGTEQDLLLLDSNRNQVLIYLVVTHLLYMTYAQDY